METNNYLSSSFQASFIYGRADQNNITFCEGNCLQGRVFSLCLFAFSLVLIIGTIVELVYNLFHLVVSCCACTNSKDQALANLIDSFMATLICTFSTLILMIRALAGAIIHPAIVIADKKLLK